jgi:hypothetical protein
MITTELVINNIKALAGYVRLQPEPVVPVAVPPPCQGDTKAAVEEAKDEGEDENIDEVPPLVLQDIEEEDDSEAETNEAESVIYVN